MRRKVVITGYGIVSSIGNNRDEVLAALKSNRSGIVAMPQWSEYGFKSQVAGIIKMEDVNTLRKDIGSSARYMDLSAIYAFIATQQAVADSCLSSADIANDRTGCIVGSGLCSTHPISKATSVVSSGKGKNSPYGITRCMSSSTSANIANFYGCKGRSYSISSACATSLHNIGHAFELVSTGICDTVIAGGSEEVSPVITSMFEGMRNALSKSFNETPTKASRPYDRKRDGFVISGGGGMVIVEAYEKARARNAPIYAEIAGFGASTDGHDIVQPQPQGRGASRCMTEALNMAKCPPEAIDYINTHGTSTTAGDLAEVKAIQKVFNGYRVPLSSTKSITGHAIGAAGVNELIYCLLMMQEGFISASININKRDPVFDDINIITNNVPHRLDTVLTNSFGFGGTNACLIVKKPQQISSC